MFKTKPPYSVQELGEYVKYLETLDRLTEKSKRNWLGSGLTFNDQQSNKDEYDKAKAVYDGYTKALLVSQQTYMYMLQSLNK